MTGAGPAGPDASSGYRPIKAGQGHHPQGVKPNHPIGVMLTDRVMGFHGPLERYRYFHKHEQGVAAT